MDNVVYFNKNYKNRSRFNLFHSAKVQEICYKVVNDHTALMKALFILFNGQEYDEQMSRTSLYKNMKGFRWSHASEMTKIAISVLNHNTITDEQKKWLLEPTQDHEHRILMYWNQFTEKWGS